MPSWPMGTSSYGCSASLSISSSCGRGRSCGCFRSEIFWKNRSRLFQIPLRIGYVAISIALEKVIEHYKLRSYRPTHYVFSINGHPVPEPVGISYFYKRHVKIIRDLDLFEHDYDLYSWKPTGAVALYRQSKDILRVQKHCRHSSPDQTYTYLRKYSKVFKGVDLTDVSANWG